MFVDCLDGVPEHFATSKVVAPILCVSRHEHAKGAGVAPRRALARRSGQTQKITQKKRLSDSERARTWHKRHPGRHREAQARYYRRKRERQNGTVYRVYRILRGQPRRLLGRPILQQVPSETVRSDVEEFRDSPHGRPSL